MAVGQLDSSALLSDIEDAGFHVTLPLIDSMSIDALVADLPSTGTQGGARNLLRRSSVVQRLARIGPMREIASSVLGPSCVAVRAILFDKTPGANWKVAWHQDTAVAVRAHVNVPGFVGASHKDGVPHYVAPADVLEQMLAVRLHLDPCTAQNGPVRVLPGTHRLGRLSAAEIEELRTTRAPIDCLADRGAMLVIRPLLLHASSPAEIPGHRRVLHLEFARGPLPSHLAWYDAVA